jgi:electron transport complex protein RnfB
MSNGSLAAALNDALPQTQCTRCGYADCRAYADAIANDGASINQCPPGGAEGIERLAALTARPVLTLNPANGIEGPRQLAVVDEAWCIGCTLCLQACPVDCIVGAPKQMHTVIPEFCTGCELCLPVCPVDCIALVVVTGERTAWQAWSTQQADIARRRYDIHRARRARDGDEPSGEASPDAADTSPTAQEEAPSSPRAAPSERRDAIVAATLARARAGRPPP